MCFFFSCTPWHKPIPYSKGACNQFGFGLIWKSKDQLLISDNSDGSSTSVLSSKFFQTLFLGGFIPILPENLTWWKDSCSARKMPSETPGVILFAKPLLGCVMYVCMDTDWYRMTFAALVLLLGFPSKSQHPVSIAFKLFTNSACKTLLLSR